MVITPIDKVIADLKANGYQQISDTVWDEVNPPPLPSGRFFSYDPAENSIELSIGDCPAPRCWTAIVFFSKENDAPLFTRFSVMEETPDGHEIQSIDAPGLQPISVIESTGACLAGWEVTQ